MLMASMVAASTAATAHRSARSRMRTASTSRRSGVEQLAIVEAAHGTVGRKHHGRRHHGAEQRTAARFIHARYGAETARAQLALERCFASEFATRRLRPHGRIVTVRAL
jgi:hypothetical protein